MRLDVMVGLFVGACLGYAAARAIDALGWRMQRQAALRLARAEVRRLRLLLGHADVGADDAPGGPAAGGAVLELLAAASSMPVRLHSAVERLLHRDGGLFADDALVLLLRLDDALRALEAELERVWQSSMADVADEALRAAPAASGRGARPVGAGEVAGHIAPAVPGGRAAAVRCLIAAQHVRELLDALEAAIAPRPPWTARARQALAGRFGRGVARGGTLTTTAAHAAPEL